MASSPLWKSSGSLTPDSHEVENETGQGASQLYQGQIRFWRKPQMHPPSLDVAVDPAAPRRPTALVTGANRGLGLETSRQLHAEGFRILLTSRSEKKGIAAARSLDGNGDDVVTHPLDITEAGDNSAPATDLPPLPPPLAPLLNNPRNGPRGGRTTQQGR